MQEITVEDIAQKLEASDILIAKHFTAEGTKAIYFELLRMRYRIVTRRVRSSTEYAYTEEEAVKLYNAIKI